MNISAIIMLVLILGIFLGGIAYCMTRVGKKPKNADSAE